MKTPSGKVAGLLFACLGVFNGRAVATTCEEFVGLENGVQQDGKVIVQGSGASFPNRLYQDTTFAYGFVSSTTSVAYVATGSGSGKCRIQNYCETCDHPFKSGDPGTDSTLPVSVDFAGSDSLLKNAEYEAYPDLQMLPACAGAVIPIFNVEGVEDLVLNTTVISRIFRQCLNESDSSCEPGAIYYWNDTSILELNPDLTAELSGAGPIHVVVREDKSGTTEIWKKSLASFDPLFKVQVGTSSSPTWKNVNVTMAATNAGVAATIVSTKSSIGYSVLAEAKSLGISMAKIRKSANSPPVEANSASVTFALSEKGLDFGNNGVDPASRMTADIHNAQGALAWPIVGYTYFVLRMNTTRQGATCANRKATLNYLSWFYANPAVSNLARAHGFGVLPLEAQKVVLEKLRTSFRCDGKLVYDSATKFTINVETDPLLLPPLELIKSVWETISPNSELVLATTSSSSLVSNQDFMSPTVTLDFRMKNPGQVDLVAVNYGVMFNLCGRSNNCMNKDVSIELEPSTLAKILSGTLTTWDDPEIVARNSSGHRITLDAEEILIVRSTNANEMNWESRFLKQLTSFVGMNEFELLSQLKTSITAPNIELQKSYVYGTKYSMAIVPIVSQTHSLASMASILVSTETDQLVPVTWDDELTYPFKEVLGFAFPQVFPDEACMGQANGVVAGHEFAKFIDWFLGPETLENPLTASGITFLPKVRDQMHQLSELQSSVKCFGVSVMKPKHNLGTVNMTFKVFVLCTTFFTILVAMVLVYWVVSRRKTTIIRASTWSFLVQILIGCAISVCTIVVLIQDDSELFRDGYYPTEEEKKAVYDRLTMTCILQPYLFFLGYGLVFTPLLLKNWRIIRLFENKKLKKLSIPTKELVKYEFLILGILFIILAVWTGLDGLHYVRTIVEFDSVTGKPTKSIGRCECEYPLTWLLPLLTFVIISLLYGNYLSYKGRNIPVAFSEGKWVSIALINFLECFVLCVPMLASTVDNPSLDAIVKSMFVFVVYVGTMIIIFAPKVYLSWIGYRRLESDLSTTNKVVPTTQNSSIRG